MFPTGQYKDTVTLYTPYTDIQECRIKYFRRVLNRCFWNPKSITVNNAGGTAAPEQVYLHIPLAYNSGYVNRRQWNSDGWTLRLGTATERTIVLFGDVRYPAIEEWQDSEAMGRTLSALRREIGVMEHAPSNVDEIMYGPRSMWRVSCAC